MCIRDRLWTGRSARLAVGKEPEIVNGVRASPSLFGVLGVKPIVGRTFLPGEDVIGGPRVTVLGFEMWMTRFGGRQDIVGQTIVLSEVLYQVVGIVPAGVRVVRGEPAPLFWTVAGQDSGDVLRLSLIHISEP